MIKQIIPILLILLMINLVVADTDTNNVDDTFRINTFVNYKKPCFNNGTYCSDSANCNFSVFNPDKTPLVLNLQATNNITYHNATFYVSENGLYQVDMICVDGSLKGAETFWMQITGDGFHNNIWFYVLIIFFSFGVMALGFYLSDAPIVILGTFGLYFLGLYILMYGIAGIKDTTTTWGLGLVVLGLAFYISSKSAYELVDNGFS